MYGWRLFVFVFCKYMLLIFLRIKLYLLDLRIKNSLIKEKI